VGQGPLRRRELLAAGSALLAGCRAGQPPLQGGWVGASAARGHRLRTPLPSAAPAVTRRSQVLIVGGGVSGLACARGLAAAGIDFALLELEDEAGGNSRGHRMGGMACPLGAHYLPLPGPHAHEVSELLHALGLARQALGRTVYDERMLCHSPQERLFFEGQWHEGLLPPAQTEATRRQYRQFAAAVQQAMRLGFAMPTQRAPWTPAHAALDAQSFAAWLQAQGLDDAQLRWYLDYCCRDDFGADAAQVSAWAGLHYFASRHGFHPPEDESAEREAVLTWPEGNAWLARRLAEPLGDALQTGRTVLRLREGRHEVEVLAFDEATQTLERWLAPRAVLATPLLIAGRLIEHPPAALRELGQQLRYAPWLVANLQLAEAPLQRLGAAPAWDNVRYGSAALGYVDAMHQSLRPYPGPTVLSAYWALPGQQRASLLQGDWAEWTERVLAELRPLHPELDRQLLRVDLMRWGHAMSIPVPGLRGSAALAALRKPQGRLHFAHSDLAGYSVFEEAYTAGCQAAAQLKR